MIKRFPAGFMRPCLPLLCLLAGCGKGSTHLSYTAPVVPLGISLSCDTEGIWTVSGGLATPYGTFGIGRSFATRDEFSYIVLRDRTRGTDQVFKLASTGRVDLHVVGESKIGMQKEDSNVWVIETETLSGTIDIEVTPSTSTLARVALGSGDPDLVLTANRELIVEYPGWFSKPTQMSLDSIQAVILYDRFISREHFLTVRWKEGVDQEAVRIPIRKCVVYVCLAGAFTFLA